MKIDFKKIYNSKTAIIAGVILFALIVPNFAHALNLGMIIARAIVSIVFTLFGYLVGMGAWFFESMLKIGFSNQRAVVEIGWKVIRDFSNMFFILIMVVIAFATILRFEKYGIKQILPKVIIIALLINFSLVICYVIIDFSDITATYFINQAKGGVGTDKNGQPSSISARLQDALNLTQMYVPINCDDTYNQSVAECAGESGDQKTLCQDRASQERAACVEAQAKQQKSGTAGSNSLNILIATIVGSICLLVAAFTLFAGGILLIVRLMFLWFLVMLVPIVFLCYLMPGLQENWRKWWRSFINWCLFAPIYSFFIWLALKIAVEYKLNGVKQLSDPVPTAAYSSTNFLRDGNYIIGFLFLIAILLGGLIAAKTLSLYGANTALKIGQKWAGAAKGWAQRTAMKPVKGVADRAGAGFQQARGGATAWMGKKFGGKMGRRMEARGAEIKQRAAERAYNKKYEAMLNTMSGDNLLKEVETAKGSRKLIATRKAQSRGLLREASRAQVKKATIAMKAYGAADNARVLEELRPDSIEDKGERAEAVERAIANGTHKKWSKKVFESKEISEKVKKGEKLSTEEKENLAMSQHVIQEVQRQLGATEFANVFKGWATDIKDEAKNTMQSVFDDDFTKNADGTPSDNVKMRTAYAKATGEASYAFYGDQNGNKNTYYNNAAAIEESRKYIEQLTGDGISALKGDDDKKLFARHMTTAQIEDAGVKFSGASKTYVKLELQKETDAGIPGRKEVLDLINKSAAWGGFSTAASPKGGGMTKEEAVDEIKRQAQKLETEEQQKKKKTGSITDDSITD